MRVCVLVPTYRRPRDLERCLNALSAQERRADEILVMVRFDDDRTLELLDSFEGRLAGLRVVVVSAPGVVHALNVGLEQTTCEIIAITDDDAAPHVDWLKRLLDAYARDQRIGGVGGRDVLYIDGRLQSGKAHLVGKVPRIGKHVGNHHIGFGKARQVDALKGVNCSYRTEIIRAIGFDTRLRGNGAQVYWEMSLGLQVKRAGWKLVYDPAILVDHFTGVRFDEDQRTAAFNRLAVSNAAYNEALIRLQFLGPFERTLYLCWCVFIGTAALPGILQWLRFLPSSRSLATAKLAVSLEGRRDAWCATWRDGPK